MRGEQRKIIPLCPFAKHEFDNTREYDDIRARINAPARWRNYFSLARSATSSGDFSSVDKAQIAAG